MVIKSKVLRLSSLCIAGGVAILVHNFWPSDATVSEYKVGDEGTTTKLKSGYSMEIPIEENKTQVTLAPSATALVTATVAATATPQPTQEPDKNAIPGIDYKKYINMSKYTKLGIAKVEKYLNVRKSPSVNAAVVAKMPPNAGCTIKEESKNKSGEIWCHITSGDVDGYVLKEYLVSGDKAKSMINDVGRLVIIVDCNNLNVREEESTKSSILCKISKGEKLEIVKASKDWFEVRVDVGDKTGFVSKDYVNISFELDSAIAMDEMLLGCSSDRVSLVSYAKEFLGNRYVSGGLNLEKGVDCSGFTLKTYQKFGYKLHRSSREQAAKDGVEISKSQLQPGDLVFYANKKNVVYHVAMYVGEGKIIHASNRRDGIKISNMNYTTPYKYKRIFK